MNEISPEEGLYPLESPSRSGQPDSGQGAESDGEEEEAEEAVEPRPARDPGEPTVEERLRHESTHLPFRSWCRFCVQGRMRNPPHTGAGHSAPHEVPEVAMDYCFLTKATDGPTLTVLVVKDRDSRAIMAHPVLCKGRLHQDTVEQAAQDVLRLGHRVKVLLKTDNEPALVDLRKGVVEELGKPGCPQVLLEAPPAYEPQSNGSVENAVQQVKGMVRTLMLALEARIQGEIPVLHPVMLWLVEHAGELLTKHLIGRDGRTAYARLFGKPNRGEGYEFGERVHYKRRVDASLGARWEDGIWLGRRWGTMTHIVAVSADEVVEVRAVARRPFLERWSREELQALKATPWAWKCPERAAAGEAEVIPHAPAAGEIPARPVQKSQWRRCE